MTLMGPVQLGTFYNSMIIIGDLKTFSSVGLFDQRSVNL